MGLIPDHPLAAIFPPMTEQEYEALRADITRNGLRDPKIVLYEGKILDGRHRARAADELGIKTEPVEFSGADPLSFVVSTNLHRRHLTTSQRAMVAAKLATLEQGQRADLAHNREDRQICLSSQGAAAKALKVGIGTIKHARTVRKSGTPELIAAVEKGEVAVAPAAEIARKPKEEQPEALKRHKKAKEPKPKRPKPESESDKLRAIRENAFGRMDAFFYSNVNGMVKAIGETTTRRGKYQSTLAYALQVSKSADVQRWKDGLARLIGASRKLLTILNGES